VPRGTRLGRNVKVGERVRSTDYQARLVRSGGTVERRARPAAVGSNARAAAMLAEAAGD
jgi:hypothetical protein